MSASVCPCASLIEPWRDGHIDSSQRALLEQHLDAGCWTCRSQIRYLDWLVEELRLRVPTIDEVSLQRRRNPLLLQAAQQRQRSQTLNQQRLGALKGALASVAVIGLGYVLFDRSPRVSVTRIAGQGEIKRFTEGEHSVVQLGDGRYELQVTRGLWDRSLLVRLPDGEIEDLGTIFGVTVKAGRTSAVDVRQGVVQLRLQGAPYLTLAAGSAWQLQAQSQPEAQQEAPPERALRQTEAPAQPIAARPKLSKHSASPRPANNTEDAMYLRILDLLRDDRREAARGLAQRYLQQFPDGFRRAEVLRISRID